MRTFLAALALLAVACSSPSAPPQEPAAEATSGGEAPPQEEQEPAPEGAAFPATIPVAVPLPAVPREQLSGTLRRLWSGVEEAVQVTMPPAPEGADAEGLQDWAGDTFTPWLEDRVATATEIRAIATELPEEPYEQVVGAALFGYLFEDLASAPRGAPIPESVAQDRELLTIYIEGLTEALRPLARSAFDAYVFCAQQVATSLADSAWGEWGAYCYQRSGELNEAFELTAVEDESPEASGS